MSQSIHKDIVSTGSRYSLSVRGFQDRQPPISVTDSAADKFVILMHNKQEVGIRIGITPGGCSGFEYVIEYAEFIGKFDQVLIVMNLENDSCAFLLVIDPKAMLHICGVEVGYSEGKFSSGFTFKNPNEKGKCGCGKSFYV